MNSPVTNDTYQESRPGRLETIFRLMIVGSIVLTIIATLAYLLLNQAVSAVVKTPEEAQAMTSLMCVGGVGVMLVVTLIVGSMYLMLNRTLAVAVNTDGMKAMLMSSAQNQAADADIKRAAVLALRNGQGYREAYQPPTPAPVQLAPPQSQPINVPRYSVNAEPRPWGESVKPRTQLETTIADDETGQYESLTVPLIALMKFAALEGPSRQEWGGKREVYGDCAKFFEAHGMLERQPSGGYKWRGEYPKMARRDWLMQFEQ